MDIHLINSLKKLKFNVSNNYYNSLNKLKKLVENQHESKLQVNKLRKLLNFNKRGEIIKSFLEI
jgi:hypothetical protein